MPFWVSCKYPGLFILDVYAFQQPTDKAANNNYTKEAFCLQDQAEGLQKYLQHLGQLLAFQKGIEQALGKDPKQALQQALPQGSLPQKPRVPIPGKLHAIMHTLFCSVANAQMHAAYALSLNT